MSETGSHKFNHGVDRTRSAPVAPERGRALRGRLNDSHCATHYKASGRFSPRGVLEHRGGTRHAQGAFVEEDNVNALRVEGGCKGGCKGGSFHQSLSRGGSGVGGERLGRRTCPRHRRPRSKHEARQSRPSRGACQLPRVPLDGGWHPGLVRQRNQWWSTGCMQRT
jgi:hypothetical protein